MKKVCMPSKALLLSYLATIIFNAKYVHQKLKESAIFRFRLRETHVLSAVTMR